MSQPAARVSDRQVCPQVTGVVPHVGGPTCDGEPLTRICGPVAACVMAAEDPATALRFALVEGALTVERIDLLADPTRRAPLKVEWKGRT